MFGRLTPSERVAMGTPATESAPGRVHPRHAGPVIDVHTHYDAGTRERVAEVNRQGALAAAIHLWDVAWPPRPFDEDGRAWSSLAPDLFRCHVPDLTHVGEAGFEDQLEKELREASAHGAVGVKVWKPLGLWLKDVRGRRLAINDRRLAIVWETAGELELPIMIHVGDPPPFFEPMTDDNPRIDELLAHPDWWWGGGDYASLERIHEEFEDVVRSYPATSFIGVHFGCFMSWSDVDRMLEQYGNYHVDTAAAVADLGKEADPIVREIFLRRTDRILFGTDLIRTGQFDMPEAEPRWALDAFFARHWVFFETAERDIPHPLPAQGPWPVHGLDLPSSVLHSLYWQNAERLFRLGVTP